MTFEQAKSDVNVKFFSADMHNVSAILKVSMLYLAKLGDVTKFNAKRFVDPSTNQFYNFKENNIQFAVFGIGKRSYFGKDLALKQLDLVLSMFILKHKFDWYQY